MEMIKRELIVEEVVGVEKITHQENGVVFISAGGKRRRLDNFVKVNDKKRKHEDDEDEFVSRKMRRILDIDEIDYEMVEAEMRVERAKMMADAEEKEKKHQQQIQLQNQYIQKQKQQQRLKYTLKKQQQQQQEIKNTEWLRIQNKRRKEAREKADYDDYIREKKRQQMVSYNNMCIESDEWLSEQKRKRQFLKVFENSNANDLICEQKQRRIVADRVSEMKDFMFINRK